MATTTENLNKLAEQTNLKRGINEFRKALEDLQETDKKQSLEKESFSSKLFGKNGVFGEKGILKTRDNISALKKDMESLQNLGSSTENNLEEIMKSFSDSRDKISSQKYFKLAKTEAEIQIRALHDIGDEHAIKMFESLKEIKSLGDDSADAQLLMIDLSEQISKKVKEETKLRETNLKVEQRHLDLIEKKKKAQSELVKQISELVHDVTGLNIKEAFSLAGVIKQTTDFMRIEKELSLMSRQTGAFGDSNSLISSATKGFERLTDVSLDTRLEMKDLIAITGQAEERGLKVSRLSKEMQNDFYGNIAAMERGLGTSSEAYVSYANEIRSFVGGTTEEAVSAMNDLIKVQSEAGMAFNLTGKDLDEMTKTIQKDFGNLSYTMLTTGKNGQKVFDNERMKTYIQNTAELTKKFKDVGLSAQQANEFVSKLLDLDRLEQNIFAYSQMGIGISDILNSPEKAIEKSAQGMEQISQRALSMPPLLRKSYLAAFGGLFDEKTLMAMQKGASPAELKNLMEDAEKKRKGKDAIEYLKAETLKSLGQAFDDLKPLFSATISLIKPFTSALAVIVGPLTIAIKYIGKALGAFDGLGGKLIGVGVLVGGILKMFTGKGLLGSLFKGGIGIPVVVQNDGKSGGVFDLLQNFIKVPKIPPLGPLIVPLLAVAAGITAIVVQTKQMIKNNKEASERGETGWKKAFSTAFGYYGGDKDGNMSRDQKKGETGKIIGGGLLKGAGLALMLGAFLGPVGLAIGGAIAVAGIAGALIKKSHDEKSTVMKWSEDMKRVNLESKMLEEKRLKGTLTRDEQDRLEMNRRKEEDIKQKSLEYHGEKGSEKWLKKIADETGKTATSTEQQVGLTKTNTEIMFEEMKSKKVRNVSDFAAWQNANNGRTFNIEV
jgi:hypothetical protein